MFSKELETRDYLENLRKKAEFLGHESEEINIKQESKMGDEQSGIIRLVLQRQYEFINIPTEVTEKEGKAIIDMAQALSDYNAGEDTEEVEEVKPKKVKKESKKSFNDDDEDEEEVKPKKSKKSKPKSGGERKEYDFLPTVNKGDSVDLTIKEATGTHEGQYGMQYFFVVEDEDGKEFKYSTSETNGKVLTALLESEDEPEVTIKRKKKGMGFYSIIFEGEDLLDE